MPSQMNGTIIFLPTETTDGIPTLNQMGFMATTLDPISENFVTSASHFNINVLEIGPAYGYVTMELLKRNTSLHVTAIDLDPRHIAYIQELADAQESYSSRLTLLTGDFLEAEFLVKYDAILTARVLHFMDGPTIRSTLQKCYDLLNPGGKIYIVSDSPYIRDSEPFIPEFERRSKDPKFEWPGLVLDINSFGSPSAGSLPKMFHFLDPYVLTRELERAGFKVEKASYFQRKDYPESARLDGREGTGVIGVKEKID